MLTKAQDSTMLACNILAIMSQDMTYTPEDCALDFVEACDCGASSLQSCCGCFGLEDGED